MHTTLFKATAYALLASAATVLLIGIPTAVLPNPLFTRMTPTRPIDLVLLSVTALLAGALAATYAWPARCPLPERQLTAGAVLNFLAVGCPTCNKLVLLLLGTSGALQWFQPIQPVLGLLGILLLGWALLLRLRALGLSRPRKVWLSGH